MRRHYPKAPPSKAYNRTALFALLTLRPSLDGLAPEGLARSYGVPLAEVTSMIATERERRATA